jgi:hypothetical protein
MALLKMESAVAGNSATIFVSIAELTHGKKCLQYILCSIARAMGKCVFVDCSNFVVISQTNVAVSPLRIQTLNAACN